MKGILMVVRIFIGFGGVSVGKRGYLCEVLKK